MKWCAPGTGQTHTPIGHLVSSGALGCRRALAAYEENLVHAEGLLKVWQLAFPLHRIQTGHPHHDRTGSPPHQQEPCEARLSKQLQPVHGLPDNHDMQSGHGQEKAGGRGRIPQR